MKYTKEQEERLIKDNMGLIVSLAKSFNPTNVHELDDYIQFGCIGFLRAIRDERHDTNLSAITSFAWRPIKWEILRHIQKQKKHKTFLCNMSNLIEPSYLEPENVIDYLPDSLTQRERAVVLLRYEGYSFEEIANKTLTFNKKWANKIYWTAIKKIRAANENIDG